MPFPRYLIVICILMGVDFNRPALGEAPLSVERVVSSIQKAEAKTRAVKVKGFKGRSFVRNRAGGFVPTPKMVEGTIIRDGMPGGRYVLDRTETFPIGSADSKKFGRRISSESYDGQEGRIVRPPLKAANGRERRGQAEIRAGSPIALAAYASLCDGSAACLGYFQPFLKVKGSKSPLLGDALAAMVRQGVMLGVARERIGDIQAVRISDPFGNSYWFDPARGFCLIQAISTDPAVPARLYRKLFVDQFIQLDRETWYPAQGRWEDPALSSAADRIEFSVQSVSLLRDSHFDYKVTIPAGYVVHNLILDTVFTSGGPDAE
jgi:hypothetical protein